MPQQHELELGLDTFGDITVGDDGRRLSEPDVIRNVIEEAVLADQVGADFFGGPSGVERLFDELRDSGVVAHGAVDPPEG